MGIFELLEESALALWVGESLWGYPIMLSLHAVGLSIVVGIFTMLNLRILGLLKDIELSTFKSLYQLSWVGLVINTTSGFSLFSSQATYFVTSKPFLIKILRVRIPTRKRRSKTNQLVTSRFCHYCVGQLQYLVDD